MLCMHVTVCVKYANKFNKKKIKKKRFECDPYGLNK